MLNKKGFTAQDAILWVLYGVCIMIFIAVLRNTIIQAIGGITDTHHLEHYVLYDRIVRSKDSVFYYDKTIDRIYPGIINKEKLYKETLHDLFGENDAFGVKIHGTEAKYDILYNEEIYRLGHPLYNTTNPLYGGIEHSFPVVVGDNDVLLIGLMYKKW